jgi:hypothetical protein
METENIPAQQLQGVNQNIRLQCKECPCTGGQNFRCLLWSVNCNYFILNIINYETCWLNSKIHISLAASSIPVAVKRKDMEPVYKVKILPV